MATSNNNPLIYGLIGGQGINQLHMPCNNSTAPINQGDLVYLTDGLLHALDTDGNAASALGVALQPTTVSSSLDNSSNLTPKSIMVGWNMVASLQTTAAETYTPGINVYIGADAQTITTVAGSNKVGRIVLPDGVSSVTGASGLRIGVAIVSKLF